MDGNTTLEVDGNNHMSEGTTILSKKEARCL